MYIQERFSKFKVMQGLSENQSGTTPVDTKIKPQPQKPDLTEAQKKIFENVENIQKVIENGEAGEKIVGTRASVIGKGLERIKAGLVPGASVDDIEYKQLLQTYNRLVKEYQDITKQQSQISQMLDNYVSQLDGQTKAYIEDKPTQTEAPQPGVPGATFAETRSEKPKETQSPTELTPEEKNKIDAEMKSEASKIAKKYGYNEDAFYKAVNDITYNPKANKDDTEGENTTKEEAIEEMEEIAKGLKNDPGMKNTPLTEAEKQDLVKKKEVLKGLPQHAEIEKLQKDLAILNRGLDLTQRDLNEEKDPTKKQKLEETRKKILTDIVNKNKEIESKKTDDYKKLEKEIAGLEGRVQQEIQTAIKVNPVGFSERLARNNIPSNGDSLSSQGKKNPLLNLVNELFKKLFGVDLFLDNSPSGGTGSNSNFDAGGLIGGNAAGELGSLSEQFESGGKGPESITVNDGNLGFPSYGSYQMNRETLAAFAKKMGITGNHLEISDSGEFAQNWKKKIQEIGVTKFKDAERAFIKEKYFDKQMEKIKGIGIDTSKFSLAMQNVIWSTAYLQNGQSQDIITKVITFYKGQEWNSDIEKKVIGEIYDAREKFYPNLASRNSQERRIALTQAMNSGTGVANIPAGGVESVPKRVVYKPDGTVEMTYCGETARANALRLGVSTPPNPGGSKGSANHMFGLYGSTGKLSNQPTGKVFQVFSNSVRFPSLGHVATGYVQNGQAYVLDPYLMQTNKPVPLETYKNRLGAMRGPRRVYDNGIANIG